MDVSGHQHIGVDGADVFTGHLADRRAVALSIGLGEEDRLPAVSVLDHVQRLVGQAAAAGVEHGGYGTR